VQQVNGIPKTGKDAVPYKKSALTPNLGVEDSSDDIRGGMGIDGLAELVKFVQEGGTLITEGLDDDDPARLWDHDAGYGGASDDAVCEGRTDARDDRR